MLTPFSQIEQAYRDTSILRATGGAFDKLSQVYGFPRPTTIPERYFRDALQAVAFGARGTPSPIHDVLEALFGWMGTEVTGTVAGGLAANEVQSAAFTYDCDSAGHYVRVTESDGTSNMYYAQTSNESDLLYLATLGTSYWKAASFVGVSDAVTVRFMPYIIEEHDGVLTVWLDSGIFQQPASYVQQDGSVDRTVAAPGQPYGGQVIASPSTSKYALVPNNPFPLYLGGTELHGQIKSLLKSIVPAGVHVRIVFHTWCDAVPAARLVINEIDYDQPGTDLGEFVEVYNAGNADADLTNVTLKHYDGAGGLLISYPLNIGDGILPRGERIVVGHAAILASLPVGTKSSLLTVNLNNVAAGVGVYDGVDLLDSVSWEQPWGGIPGITEGTELPADAGTADSWQRFPDGKDTDDNAADFHLASPQPGLPNI